MSDLLSRQLIPMDGVFNLRDLGHYDAAASRTKPLRFLRSDALHRIGDAGVQQFKTMGLASVIDLRFPHEIEAAPDPDWAASEIDYHTISLFDGTRPNMNSDGDLLLDMYQQAVDRQGAAFAEILDVMAHAPKGAVLFHCSAGKDRTGLIAALTLSVAGVAHDDIVTDYALTTKPMAAHRKEMEIGLDKLAEKAGVPKEIVERFFGSEPSTMQNTLDYIYANHGSPSDYLAKSGFSSSKQEKLRQRLLD